MQENFPTLVSCKPLKSEYTHLQEVKLTSPCFSVGRGLGNMLQISFLAISRDHCKFRKTEDDWFLEDNSSFGISINNIPVGKGNCIKLNHEDIIALDASNEFIYKFLCDDSPVPTKRIKLDSDATVNNDIINDMKIKFEESQNNEIKHLKNKILNTNQIKNTHILLKDQMQDCMERKINQLNNKFSIQIESLKGEKEEVEKQKMQLIKERELQLATLKQDMELRINELKDQIKKHNETESELMEENEVLKNKLAEERKEFISELSRENSSKQDLIDSLNAKMKEKEEIRLKEKKEFEESLMRKTLELRLEKEKELQEIQDQKKSLEEQVDMAEKQRLEVQKELNHQIEALKKLETEDKAKMEELRLEREELEKKFRESQANSEKNIEDLKARVTEREIELAALAAERIQKQAEQSSEVISSLQEQLEKVRNELKTVENEKKKLQEDSTSASKGECSNSQSMGALGDIMESELQCSICAELFVSAITLNCSHSFCSYCITMWKKKKKDCPICRAPITSECKSLVLDSFIEKMVQNLSDEMKKKREDILNNRKELESELLAQQNSSTARRSDSNEYDDYSGSDVVEEEEEEEQDLDEYDFFGYEDYGDWEEYDYDSGSDEYSEGNVTMGSGESNDRAGRGRVPGRPGAYYGGYGRCFRCGARGHWAPGCPLA